MISPRRPPENSSVSTCRTDAEIIPPLAAVAADRVGSIAWENTFSSSSVRFPSPIIELMLPITASSTTSVPARTTGPPLLPEA